MNSEMLKEIHGDNIKKRPDVRVGDTVKLHMRISEGNKSRIQIFEGIVLAIKGTSLDQTLTVRKISGGVGVERIVPMHSPLLEKIEVIKRGSVRQSKIYYMRERVGKKAMKVGKSEQVYYTDEEEVVADEETEASAEEVVVDTPETAEVEEKSAE